LLLFLTDDATQVLFSSQICRNSRRGPRSGPRV